METIDVNDLDFEGIFEEWLEELQKNKATSFLVDNFKHWLVIERKYFKGMYHVKGSNHGQREGDHAIHRLVNDIVLIWKDIGIIKESENHHNYSGIMARRRVVKRCYDIV